MAVFLLLFHFFCVCTGKCDSSYADNQTTFLLCKCIRVVPGVQVSLHTHTHTREDGNSNNCCQHLVYQVYYNTQQQNRLYM